MDGEAMEIDELNPPGDLKVTFFPYLFEQRRAWVLDILRREGVTSIVDVGCGEGALLSCLCNPALYLTAPARPARAEDIPELHVQRLAGLDVSAAELETCIAETAPPTAQSRGAVHSGFKRWEPLSVKIWKGGLEAYNAEFVGVECIVAMEVIEHLAPPLVSSFAPVLLGAYRPRLLLVTTPSYDFNARFAPPGVAPRTGYPDPTRRTARIFRHADHKFEWTVREFRAWCEDGARRWGYDVRVEGVGRAVEPDAWGRDEELGCASQVALFRRRDELRIPGALDVIGEVRHELLAEHQHGAHPLARKPRSPAEVQAKVKSAMRSFRLDASWTILQLWAENEVAEICGGVIDNLVEAVEGCDDFVVAKSDEELRAKWVVSLVDSTSLDEGNGGEDQSDSENTGWRTSPEWGQRTADATTGDVEWRSTDSWRASEQIVRPCLSPGWGESASDWGTFSS